MNKIIGFILVFGTIAAAMFLGGSPGYFLDIPSLVFVLGIVMGSLIWKFGFNSLKSFWSEPAFCQLGQHTSLIAGMLGPIIGIIHILQNLSDPKGVGPAVAVSLLTFLYGIIFNLLFLILKKEKSKVGYITDEKGMIKFAFLGFFLSLSTVMVLLFSLN